MGGATAAVAAASARARRRVVSHFMSRNAVSAEHAVGFTPERRLERRFFERLRDEGVIVPARNGTFYIDAPKLDAFQARRRTRVKYAIATALAAVVAGIGVGLLP